MSRMNMSGKNTQSYRTYLHIQTNQRYLVMCAVCSFLLLSCASSSPHSFYYFFYYANESDIWYVTRFNLEMNTIRLSTMCKYITRYSYCCCCWISDYFTTLNDAFHLVLWNFIFGKSPATLYTSMLILRQAACIACGTESLTLTSNSHWNLKCWFIFEIHSISIIK